MIIKRIVNEVKYAKMQFVSQREDKIAKKLIQNMQQPIYHVHIRKTAGTTINFAFISNSNCSNTDDLYESIAQKNNHRQIINNKVYVGWNVQLINQGYFSYAFSHTPFHQLNLHPDTFIFTCLRDPIKRVLSHYNMLRYFQLNNINHPCMQDEGKWLGNSFDDFIVSLPKEHLLNQLYMFSNSFNIEEAAEGLMSLNKIIFTESLSNGMKELELLTGWRLPLSNQKNYGFKEELTSNQLDNLRERLNLEYKLLEIIKPTK